jgi:hypothetical protein
LQTFTKRVIIGDMNSDDDFSTFASGHWQVQPRCVQALTIAVAVPAFLALVAGIEGRLETIALFAFAAIAILQLAFLLRAYWRMDL